MNGKRICIDDKCEKTALYEFRKTFRARKGDGLVMKICAEGRYRLFINGVFVSAGPCQGSSFVRYYDEIDAGKLLKTGENLITVRIVYPAKNEWITFYRDERPELWVEAELTDGGKTVRFGTDKDWKCFRDDSVGFFRDPGYQNTIPEFEILRGSGELVPVNVFENGEADIERGGVSVWGVCYRAPMMPRLIPQMENGEETPLRAVKSGPGFIELDAGKYVTARVRFSLTGEKGKSVRIVYAECYLTPCEGGGYEKRMRDCFDAGELRGPCDIVETSGEKQTFEPFWYRAFRFVRIEFSGEFSLSEAVFAEEHYPLGSAASFSSSDKELDRIWDVSVNTLKCCMHETYIDCPHYEQLQYCMDSALEALYTYYLTPDLRLPKKSLIDLAHSQRPDGMLQSSYPSQLVQVIPSFSLFWIFMLKDYLVFSGDRELALSMTGTADRILEGFRSFLDERGLVGKTPYWHFVDWVPGWDRGVPPGGEKEPLTVYSLMYASALLEGAEICEACGRSLLAKEYRARSKETCDAVRRYCFDGEKGLFGDTPSKNSFSELVSSWAVISGAVTGQEAVRLMKRTLSGGAAKCSFAASFYLFRALEMTGLYDAAFERLALWRDMLKMHCTTWCENPDAPRSECHGWSSVPVFELSAVILGVKPGGIGYESVTISPYTCALDSAEGKVPTPHGPVSVSWKKKEGKLIFDAVLPKALLCVVTLEGDRYESRDTHIHIERELK